MSIFRNMRRGLALISALVMLASGCVYASAEQIEKPKPMIEKAKYSQSGGLFTKEFELEQPTKVKNEAVGAVSLPASYSSQSLISKIEDQGNHNLCWAFVQNTLAAINVRKDEGKNVDYSETHMAYSTAAHLPSAGLNSNPAGFSRNVDDGGHCDMSIAYLSRGSGMVANSEDPYIAGAFPYRSAAAIDSYFSTGYLVEAPILHGCDVRQVKELIYRYGAAGASIYYDDYYYNRSSNMYCCPYNYSVNHGVTLIGWDDNAGCFLAVNSWGSDWGSNGYFRISYDDALVCKTIFATDYQSGYLPYDGIRSYNPFGWVSYYYSGYGESLYYSTTYDTGAAKALEGIGTYTIGENTRVEVYVNPYNGNGMDGAKFQKVHTETIEKPGYYHLSFNSPINLYGSQFNVKIKVTSAVGGQTYIPLQANAEGYILNSRFQNGRNYYGESDGKMWLLEDFTDINTLQNEGYAWAMHAFTKSDISVNIDQSRVVNDSEGYYILMGKNSSGTCFVKRSGATLPIYKNAACTTEVASALAAGTYYLKLQNGTHIRQKITIVKSSITPQGGINYINGVARGADGAFTVRTSGSANVFDPIVSTGDGAVAVSFYALPGGIAPVAMPYKPTLSRTVLYARVLQSDNITYAEYPVVLIKPGNATSGYTDTAKVSNWAKTAMNESVKMGLIQGSSGKLNPQNGMSRAEAATILLRAAGIDSSKVGAEYAAGFGDVKLNEWYAKAVGTASFIGMVDGHSNFGYRAFSPSDIVTREQFAVMMIRLLAYSEGVSSQNYINRYLSDARIWVATRGFADLSKVSSWARDAVAVALYLGVFSGANVNGRLYIQPTNKITREQAAVMMYNSMDLIY